MTIGFSEQGTIYDGIRRKYTFENSYGASVISHSGSYGGKFGLWELAVLYNDDLCYTTPITNDVIGWLNEEDLQVVLNKIKSLPDPP